MADNTTYTEGSGISVATDDVSGVHHQRVKIEQGSDGVAADISPTSPLAVRPGHPSTGFLTNASLSFATSGNNTLVAATASQTTRVFRIVLVFEGAVGIKFISGSTDQTGVMKMKDGGSIVLDFDGEPWFVTGSNEAFIANLDAAINVRGFIQYEKTA
mgnify:CR=1 FL=1